MMWIGIAAGIFLLDYGIKAWVEKNLKADLVKEIAGDRILLRKFHNPGFALGMGNGKPGLVKAGSLLLWVLLAAGYLWLLTQKGLKLAKMGGAMILGGGASNLADRIWKGHVTDYFSFNVKGKKLRSLVFNLSDWFIAVGTLLAVIGLGKRR